MNKKNTLYHELECLVKENPKNYVTVLKSAGFQDKCQNRQHLRNYVIAMTPLLIDTPSFKYKWKTRVYWVLNGIENWNDVRVKCIVCGKPFVSVDVKNVTHGYSKKTYAAKYAKGNLLVGLA